MSNINCCPLCKSQAEVVDEIKGEVSCSNKNGPNFCEMSCHIFPISVWNKLNVNWQEDIKDMMKAFGQEVRTIPSIPNEKIMDLRADLIYEEVVKELLYHMGYVLDPPEDGSNDDIRLLRNPYRAKEERDLVNIADGIVDSIVVLLGAACALGINIQPVWDEVHRTNMEKANGPIREDGKRLKPEGWQPPKIREILIKQGMKEKN